ncbi:methyltransferase type 11 [Roseivirga seohaensis]|uniref:Methyltransferase type 11 n=1 Tax=Roseivirga seohaensis TaxID=1914963 RepID=A0A150Y1W7_9BACT|nr:class I SAM-dependent methyltransferase [Roseivirga seohaensis]KYG84977.1 methyltransferase type 11 [Roseivirga seohaensis]
MKSDYEITYHDVESEHFWFKARRSYILQLLEKTPRDVSILDIGCSSGILLNELIDKGFERQNLYGIDISEKAIANCKRNNIQNSFVMDAQEIILDKKFDVIIASDCLEHLKDDKKALINWHSLLKPNGTLLVFVPAFMSLWSAHDVFNMHFRRYTKPELTSKLKKTGFKIQKASYWNFLLFTPVFVFRTLNRLRKSKSEDANGDLSQPSMFNESIYKLINFENKLLKRTNFPFGVSTFCIAKKLES